jgi:NAD(P)-dependent dehydrogenase (short-subunit alcohol dehydrogenase family)
MPHITENNHAGTIFIAGASRGIGHAMSAEFLKRGWHVIGTVRGAKRTQLHDLAEAHPERVDIVSLDIADADSIAALRDRLAERRIDILFVNAGTANSNPEETAADVATDDFTHVMITNALSPMRVIDRLQDLVPADGVIGVMTSGQGSIANNRNGQRDIYRASKAALNMFMQSYAARHPEDPRALLLLAPGWIQTALGGPSASFTLEETIPAIVDTVLSQQGRRGLRYLDREGKTVPW